MSSDGEPLVRWDMPILSFDLETTDPDKHECGIVQFGMALQQHADAPVRVSGGIVNCPEPVETAAFEVHGISNERKIAEGMEVTAALNKIVAALQWAERSRALVVAFNMQFDYTVLVNNANRAGYREPHPSRFVETCALYDPLVISRTFNRYKKGGHTLGTIMDEYDLEDMVTAASGPHDAAWDAEVALLIAREQMATGMGALDGTLQSNLTGQMRAWHVDWAERFQEWVRQNRDPGIALEMEWPVAVPVPQGAPVAQG